MRRGRWSFGSRTRSARPWTAPKGSRPKELATTSCRALGAGPDRGFKLCLFRAESRRLLRRVLCRVCLPIASLHPETGLLVPKERLYAGRRCYLELLYTELDSWPIQLRISYSDWQLLFRFADGVFFTPAAAWPFFTREARNSLRGSCIGGTPLATLLFRRWSYYHIPHGLLCNGQPMFCQLSFT